MINQEEMMTRKLTKFFWELLNHQKTLNSPKIIQSSMRVKTLIQEPLFKERVNNYLNLKLIEMSREWQNLKQLTRKFRILKTWKKIKDKVKFTSTLFLTLFSNSTLFSFLILILLLSPQFKLLMEVCNMMRIFWRASSKNFYGMGTL